MSLYLITYDLRQPGRNYKPLYDLLNQWQAKKVAESVWIADLKGPASAIRDLLQETMDANDRVVVLALVGQFGWAAKNAMPEGVALLKRQSP